MLFVVVETVKKLVIYKMLKIAFADNAMGEHRLLNAFLNSNMGKLQLRIVSDQVTPPQVAQTKHGENSQNHQ
jgi:hypothetical protein